VDHKDPVLVGDGSGQQRQIDSKHTRRVALSDRVLQQNPVTIREFVVFADKKWGWIRHTGEGEEIRPNRVLQFFSQLPLPAVPTDGANGIFFRLKVIQVLGKETVPDSANGQVASKIHLDEPFIPPGQKGDPFVGIGNDLVRSVPVDIPRVNPVKA